MTSMPGARDLRSDALVGSSLPAQLRELGYIVERTGETQRVHAMRIAIVEMYDLRVPNWKNSERT